MFRKSLSKKGLNQEVIMEESLRKWLHYNLKILKDSENIETKELIELYKEHEESIKNLEDWAIELPKNNR